MLVDLRDHLQATLSGTYTLERELDGGGMSRVFIAEEHALNRRVVVKVLSPHLAAGVNVERFKREIQLTARLQHPHIVPILCAGEASGLPFYVMPYVDGESLRARLSRVGPLPVTIAASILRDVAKALEFAHEKGIVHRDIKPDNVLLAGSTAAVSDFGIGKAIAASRISSDSATLTDFGSTLGTPQYMAPEQVAADPAVDHRADLYAFGCMAYELLTGEPPFAGRSAAALFRAHIVEDPAPIGSKRADVPSALAALIGRCLEKDPARRPSSARELFTVLDVAASSASASAHVTPAKLDREFASVVVLPFVNLSADPENEHFADGLTDEIITDLSMIGALRVISRSSAMRLKGSDKDVRTIARELGVRYALTGGIRRAGSNLRITAQLVDSASDIQLWADKYTGALDDVFDIQERLSRQIVEALRLQLTPAEDKRIAERPISDVQAYEFYLLARQEIWRFTDESLAQALRLIRNAQEIVGDNELLFAAEGMIYWQYVNVGLIPVEEYEAYLLKAEACATKIFELNPESAKGYALRGSVWNNRANPSAAVRDFKSAVALDPSNPEALLWLGYCYSVSGRIALAKTMVDRLMRVDPITSINVFFLAWIELMQGHYDKALQWMQRAVDMDPENPSNRQMYALMLAANERIDEACAVLQQVGHDAPKMAWARLALTMRHALRGEREEVMRVATPELRAAALRDDLFAWWMAGCMSLVGEKDSALDFLERAVEFGFINYPYLAEYDPFLGNVRGERRFQHLMVRVRRAWEAFQP